MGVLRRLKKIGSEFKAESKKEWGAIKRQAPKAKANLRRIHEGAKKTHKGLKKVHASLPKVDPEAFERAMEFGMPKKKKKKKSDSWVW